MSAAASPRGGVGRPPSYCSDPAHTRQRAHRAWRAVHIAEAAFPTPSLIRPDLLDAVHEDDRVPGVEPDGPDGAHRDPPDPDDRLAAAIDHLDRAKVILLTGVSELAAATSELAALRAQLSGDDR